jgi:hypothetical protein
MRDEEMILDLPSSDLRRRRPSGGAPDPPSGSSARRRDKLNDHQESQLRFCASAEVLHAIDVAVA